MSWSCDVLWESSSWTFCQSQPHQLCILWKHKFYWIESIADSWTQRKPYILSSSISLRHKTLESSLKPTASSRKIPKFDGYASNLAVSQDTAVFQNRPPRPDILPHNWPFFCIDLILLRIILLTWTAFEAYLNVRLIQGRLIITVISEIGWYTCLSAYQPHNLVCQFLNVLSPCLRMQWSQLSHFQQQSLYAKLKKFHLLGFQHQPIITHVWWPRYERKEVFLSWCLVINDQSRVSVQNTYWGGGQTERRRVKFFFSVVDW